MAKKKEKKVEKPSKITNEELNKVQSVVHDINRAQLEIGSFETKKHSLLHHISKSQEKLGEMQLEFEKKYGTADIDIKEGTINYKPEPTDELEPMIEFVREDG